MRASELMIGDWVNFLIDIEGCDTEYDPKNEIYQPMQIVNLTAWGNYDGEVESTEGVINDIDQVKPIPLTVEILEKNGFMPISKDKYVYAQVTVDLDESLVIIKSKDARMTINIAYVHQLQHAMRLCLIEKEIEL